MNTSKNILIIVVVMLGVALIGGGWYFAQKNNKQTSELVAQNEKRPAVDISEDEALREDVSEEAGDQAQIATRMDINPSAKPIVAQVEINSSDIQGFVFSSSVFGENASLFDHSSNFYSGNKTLWLTIRLSKQSTSDKVLFSMMYAKDKSVLGPASVAVKEQNGSKFAVFKLSSPAQGWPVGDYVGSIYLPNGDSKTFNFKID